MHFKMQVERIILLEDFSYKNFEITYSVSGKEKDDQWVIDNRVEGIFDRV